MVLQCIRQAFAHRSPSSELAYGVGLVVLPLSIDASNDDCGCREKMTRRCWLHDVNPFKEQGHVCCLPDYFQLVLF